MPRRSFANRRELEEHSFPPAVLLLVPFVALFLHAYLPRLWRPLDMLDLPLIVVVYLAVSWRSPIRGTLTGAVIGLLQDLPGNQYIGVNGIAKAILGYVVASIGLKVDVENAVTRVGMSFAACLLQSLLLFAVQRLLLGQDEVALLWAHELIKAGVNAAVALPVFFLPDRARVD